MADDSSDEEDFDGVRHRHKDKSPRKSTTGGVTRRANNSYANKKNE